jgi:two-component system chemotaxis response regulator CheB
MSAPSNVPPRRLVVIGASAGGIEALRTLIAALPADFPAAVAVVLHMAPASPGVLSDVLARAGTLPVTTPATGTAIRSGYVYVAPPDYHLLIEPGRLRLTKGPRENRFRPAIDPLFRSAAQVYGPAAIGVVLTGSLDDGTAGLWMIKQLGGVAVAQDPAEAMFPSMPDSAIRHVNVDYVAPLSEIAPLLVRLTTEAVSEAATGPGTGPTEVEVQIANEEDPLKAGVEQIAEPSTFSCPECNGVLLQLKVAGRIRFRCHTGHAYSAESLLAEIGESIARAAWTTLRLMQEGDMLMRQMADHVEASHSRAGADVLRTRADEISRKAAVLRELVTSEKDATPTEP